MDDLESHRNGEGSPWIPRVCFPGPNPSSHSALPAQNIQKSPGTRRYGQWLSLLREKQRRILSKIPQEKVRPSGKPIPLPSSHGVMLPLSQFCRKWCCGGRVTLYGRACPTRQPSPHSASRAQPPWGRCGPPASCLTTTAGSRPPGPRSCWAPTQHPHLPNIGGWGKGRTV